MIRASPILLVAACATVASQAQQVDLHTLAANASAHNGQIVRTCGWARNGFEDQSISVAEHTRDHAGRPNPGLTVTWLESAPLTEHGQAEWRCIAGRVQPVCPDLAPDEICITNASPYWDWEIVQQPQPGERFRDCAYCPEMVAIPGGSFLMGSPRTEQGRRDDEGPRRRVTIQPLAVGRFEVTFDQWAACVNRGGCNSVNPDDEGWGRGDRPVINVTWNDAQAYVRWLSDETGQAYRLLSEAEWEYAARAGTRGRFSNNGGYADLCAIANHADGSTTFSWRNTACSDGVGDRTAPVGSYAANAFGLHDMHGNVSEWVQDCYALYVDLPRDGSAHERERPGGLSCSRVLRGGSWQVNPLLLRSASRSRHNYPFLAAENDIGFRVARIL